MKNVSNVKWMPRRVSRGIRMTCAGCILLTACSEQSVLDHHDFSGPPTNTALIVDLDFEGDTTLEFIQERASDKRCYYEVRPSGYPGRKHSLIQDAEPKPATAIAKITDGAGLHGSRGLELAFSADEKTAEHDKERMELYMAHGDREDALRLGDVRYLGYALYIDPESPPPIDHATITQCWQLPTSRELFRSRVARNLAVVPMWMTLRNVQGKPGYFLHVKNEGTPVDGKFQPGSEVAGRGQFEPGWNILIYRFEPRHRNDPTLGRITFWLNNLDENNPTHDMVYNWGVTPDPERPEGWPVTGYRDVFDVRLGIYRPKEPRNIRLLFDNIRYGKKFLDVLPVHGLSEIE